VTAFDPVVSSVSLPGLTIVADPHDVAGGADAIVVATELPDFLLLDLGDLRRRMRGDVLLDGRGLFDRAQAAAAGFRHLALGRPSTNAALPPVTVDRRDDVDVAVSRSSEKQLRPGDALVSAHETTQHGTSDSTERESATWEPS
jgi:hypothetical protein